MLVKKDYTLILRPKKGAWEILARVDIERRDIQAAAV